MVPRELFQCVTQLAAIVGNRGELLQISAIVWVVEWPESMQAKLVQKDKTHSDYNDHAEKDEQRFTLHTWTFFRILRRWWEMSSWLFHRAKRSLLGDKRPASATRPIPPAPPVRTTGAIENP